MASFVDVCRFTAASSGTGTFTVSAAVTGYQTPASANAVDGATYRYRAESADLTQWEVGYGVYTAAGTTLTRATILFNSSGGSSAINFSAAPQVALVALAEDLSVINDVGLGFKNLSLSVSAAASALTIALKDAAGNDPSGNSPVSIFYRSATGTTGTVTKLDVTAATSLTISSGSTLGVTSSTAFRLWVVGFNDGGTFRLGVINCSTVSTTAAQIYSLEEVIPVSSTAEGGAGAADSAGVFYTGTAVTTKAFRILGYIEWSSSGLTAGTWTTTNLLYVQVFGPGIRKPGDIVQTKMASTGSVTQTTSSTPQSTGVTASITPKSAANPIYYASSGQIRSDNGNASNGGTQMFRDATGVGSVTFTTIFLAAAVSTWAVNKGFDLPNTTSSTTYTVKLSSSDNATNVRYPNGTGGNYLGEITLQEIMG